MPLRRKVSPNDKAQKLINRYWSMQCGFSIVFSLSFSPSSLLGDFYILYRPFHIIWALHLLIIQTSTWTLVPLDTPLNSLWVAVAKVALFRSLLLINAARIVVVMHLMWWWQPLLRYFGFPSFLRIGKINYSG